MVTIGGGNGDGDHGGCGDGDDDGDVNCTPRRRLESRLEASCSVVDPRIL